MWMGVFMLVGEMALDIRLLAKRGKGLRAIAREIGVSRNTVRRYLRDGDAVQSADGAVLQGSSLETVCNRSHLLRQFQSDSLSPPVRSPRWMAGFLGFLGQTC
jgi:hypothetical protein